MEQKKNDSGLFDQYASLLKAQDVTRQDNIDERLLIAKDGDLAIYYSPFDYVEPRARIVLVGITPGMVQARNALREASIQLRKGASHEEALYHAKVAASFSGPMRRNLVDLLDGVGINDWLGLDTASELFISRTDLVHYTSVLRYPTFYCGKNYSGSPAPHRSRLLTDQIEQWFHRELEVFSDAIFIPLGGIPRKVLADAIDQGMVEEGRVLDGLPHPSGANAERIAYFLGRKSAERCSSKCDTSKLDLARESVIGKIAAIRDLVC